jgi:hypothetical protein
MFKKEFKGRAEGATQTAMSTSTKSGLIDLSDVDVEALNAK